MRAYERLLKYVRIDTPSDESTHVTPSTPIQFDLAKLLVEELKELGLADAAVDGTCYVYAHLPASPGCENAVPIGFISHMDTAPDFNGRGVRPQVLENYDGGDVALGNSGRVLRVSDFPHLAALKGRTLIHTDGTSLLGADDKAGVAEIMTLLERLRDENLPHGPLSVCFTPDEEIGEGADHFDLHRFGARYAYTVDGDAEGGIEYENFNAAAVTVTFHGFNIHPGDAKNKMVNAALVAMQFNSMLPALETPRGTSGREGFYHLTRMEGDVEKAVLSYIIRDHDFGSFQRRKLQMRAICAFLNEKYGPDTAVYDDRDQYLNMLEIIEQHRHLIDNARKAILAAGVDPVEKPVRGGTDGARLSFMGLPCPNLGTGGHAFHGPFEHITAEGMDIAVDILEGIVGIYAEIPGEKK